MDAISMNEAKDKLRNLSQYMPDQEETIYEFGKYLADRLNPELLPMGFVMACELALYDLQKGVDGFSGQPIRSRLVGYPPMIYALLRMMIDQIAEAIFPEDFANAVKEERAAIMKKA